MPMEIINEPEICGVQSLFRVSAPGEDVESDVCTEHLPEAVRAVAVDFDTRATVELITGACQWTLEGYALAFRARPVRMSRAVPKTATDPSGVVHTLGPGGRTVCGRNAKGWPRTVTELQRLGLVELHC